jgi:hypothetical protein
MWYGAKEGRGKASQAYVMDIVCPPDEVMPGQENPLRILAEAGGKLRGNPRRPGQAHTAKKIFVAVETRASVPQTDSGR